MTHVVVAEPGDSRFLGYYTLVTDHRKRDGLLRALRQTEEAARVMGIHALVLDAFDDAAREWYLAFRWGFHTLPDDPRHLFLPVETIRELGF